MKRLIPVLMSGALLLSTAGCFWLLAGAAGGAGTAVWLSGKLSQTMNASRDKTVRATELALTTMKMETVKKTESPEVTQIKSNYTDGREVWIDVRPVTENSSQVEVRVGMTGDKAAAEKILDQIRKSL